MIAAALVLLACISCRERVERVVHALPSATTSRAPPRPRINPLPKDSIWHSRQACERVLSGNARLPRAADKVRLATWNIRWFPDGRPGRRPSGTGTDIAWLACAIAWLDAHAVAVQEFKAHARARERAAELIRNLDRLTSGRWKLVLDDCRDGDASQHVGILYDESRVRASEPRVIAALNPHGDACKNQLRPGLALALRFPGGLDLHFVSLHAKSGSDRRSFELRKRSLDATARALEELSALGRESDVVFAGDFNTMGCTKCSPSISADSELTETDRRLSAISPGFWRVGANATCTQRSTHGPGLLDHFVVTRGTRELAHSATARVSGYCADTACRLVRSHELDVERALSDHCPVLLDLTDRDLD